MAEEAQDEEQKTEEATPRRLEEAREKGQFAQSRELAHFIMLGVGAMILLWVMPWVARRMITMFQSFISDGFQFAIHPHKIQFLSANILWGLAQLIMIPCVSILILVLAFHLLQSGFTVSSEHLIPKLSRISIREGAKRLFSSKSLIELIKGLIKVLVLGWALYWAFKADFLKPDTFLNMMPQAAMNHGMTMLGTLFLITLIIVGCVAALDFLYQRWMFLKNLRMTREELKQELKQSEGDPQIKARIRQLRQERAKSRMMAAVPTSTVVITNPTHFAVALKYDKNTMNAPRVVAKGKDLVALKIREIATENKVPLVRNPPLAQALFKNVDLDQEIPEVHYKAVAEVIRYVMRLPPL